MRYQKLQQHLLGRALAAVQRGLNYGQRVMQGAESLIPGREITGEDAIDLLISWTEIQRSKEVQGRLSGTPEIHKDFDAYWRHMTHEEYDSPEELDNHVLQLMNTSKAPDWSIRFRLWLSGASLEGATKSPFSIASSSESARVRRLIERGYNSHAPTSGLGEAARRGLTMSQAAIAAIRTVAGHTAGLADKVKVGSGLQWRKSVTMPGDTESLEPIMHPHIDYYTHAAANFANEIAGAPDEQHAHAFAAAMASAAGFDVPVPEDPEVAFSVRLGSLRYAVYESAMGRDAAELASLRIAVKAAAGEALEGGPDALTMREDVAEQADSDFETIDPSVQALIRTLEDALDVVDLTDPETLDRSQEPEYDRAVAEGRSTVETATATEAPVADRTDVDHTAATTPQPSAAEPVQAPTTTADGVPAVVVEGVVEEAPAPPPPERIGKHRLAVNNNDSAVTAAEDTMGPAEFMVDDTADPQPGAGEGSMSYLHRILADARRPSTAAVEQVPYIDATATEQPANAEPAPTGKHAAATATARTSATVNEPLAADDEVLKPRASATLTLGTKARPAANPAPQERVLNEENLGDGVLVLGMPPAGEHGARVVEAETADDEHLSTQGKEPDLPDAGYEQQL